MGCEYRGTHQNRSDFWQKCVTKDGTTSAQCMAKLSKKYRVCTKTKRKKKGKSVKRK